MRNKNFGLLLGILFIFSTAAWTQTVDPATLLQAKNLLSKSNQNAANPNLPQTQPLQNETEEESAKNEVGIKEEFSRLEQSLSANITTEGFEIVRQFGYDIFKKTVSSFIPQEGVPVGSDYIVGPGDSFNITMWGVSEGIFKVTVNQNGEITLPKVGVVNVAGLTFGQLKPLIESKLNKFYEGINLGLSFDQLKTIRVYVVGEVKQPGSYSLSSLSTAYNALFYAGGPTKQGTLRNIKVIRNGILVATVDLYKFLLNGDKSQDRQLMDGDTVFVPIIGEAIAVAGNVNRPAIYEIKGKADLADIIFLAGGINAATYLNRVQIERTIAHEKKIIMDKEISFFGSGKKLGITVSDMDIIKIFPIFSKVTNYIYLKGDLKYPGTYEYKPGMKLLDALKKDLIDPQGEFPKLEVVRILKEEDLRTVVYNIDYKKLFVDKDDSFNIFLQPRDEIFVYTSKKENERVALKGEFKRPGTYVISIGENISSVIGRAGGYTDYAYIYGAILTRKSVKKTQDENFKKLIEKLQLDLMRKERELSSGILAAADIAVRQANYASSRQIIDYLRTMVNEGRVIIRLDDISKLKGSANDMEMEDGDELLIPKMPRSIVVLGQVYTPNAVAFREGIKVKDCLNYVGGPTETADTGSIYVVRADGSVNSRRQGFDIMSLRLNPGDSVLVPEKLETISFWGVLKEFTHWIYEAAVSVAVINTVVK